MNKTTKSELINGMLLVLMLLWGVWAGVAIKSAAQPDIKVEDIPGLEWEIRDNTIHFTSFPYPIR